MMAPTENAAKKQFYTSLDRTGAGYFDYYLLHALMENIYTKYEKFHLWDFELTDDEMTEMIALERNERFADY